MYTKGYYSIISLVFAISCQITNGGDVVLPPSVMREIAQQKGFVDKFKQHVLYGPGKHETHGRLANLTDYYGHRFAGSQVLEDAIDAVKEAMLQDGLYAYTENVTFPAWKRDKESAQLLLPRNYTMRILGLGYSVATPPGGIEADAIVVRSFNELDQNAKKVRDKIVVFNQPYKNYGQSVKYRATGAVRAEKHGAVATLIRSVTPLSVYSPHTGAIDGGMIPAASITVEDAEMLYRMRQRGQRIRIKLVLESRNEGNATSRNLIAEIKGSKYPEQVVVIGGHWDSWDVGQGAMDDGGGALISWMALTIVKRLGFRPKRTLRAVLWTAEELDCHGAKKYYQDHKQEARNMSIILESDAGTFSPLGIGFTGNDSARAIMREILKYTSSLNASQVGSKGSGPDIYLWIENDNVPGGYLMNKNEKYFYYHHSEGDTMTVEDPDELDRCLIVWGVTAFIVANLEDMLPRDNPFPTAAPSPGTASGMSPFSWALACSISLSFYPLITYIRGK